MYSPAKRSITGDLATGDQQFDVIGFSSPKAGESVNEAFEILVWFDVSRIEQESIMELVALAHTGELFYIRRFVETVVDSVVNNLNFVWRHRAVLEDVSSRSL